MQNRKFKHVIVVGIDGAGAFIREADTPRIDEVFANGAVTYRAHASVPTISAQCWGSMLIGASAAVHGLTNSSVDAHAYDVDSALPTVFRRIRQQYPQAKLASFSNWRPINTGIAETNIGVVTDTGEDDVLTDRIVSYIKSDKPDFLFIQLDSVDHAGHHYGYGTKEYYAQINEVDGYLGRIYDAAADAGIIDDTLFMAIADHGGTPEGGHGGLTDWEKYVYFGAAGNGVVKSEIPKMNIRDLAAIILHAFGIEQPAYDARGWTAQVPNEVFADLPQHDYLEIEPIIYEKQSRPTPERGTDGYITNFIPEDKIAAALFLDSNCFDQMRKCRTASKNVVKYYSGGVYGSYAELGGVNKGYITLDTEVGANSFSIAAWIKMDSEVVGETVIAANKREHTKKGISIILRQTDIFVNISDGSDDYDINYAMPDDFKGGWLHMILVMNREDNTCGMYYQFKNAGAVKLRPQYPCASFDAEGFTICKRGEGSYDDGVLNIDDFIFFNKALTSDEVAALEKYYL